jgi:hypothetical protein
MPAIVAAKLHVEGALFSGMAALRRSAQPLSIRGLKLKESFGRRRGW